MHSCFLSFSLLCAALVLADTLAQLNPIVRPINRLGAEIHKKLGNEGNNIFFSPTSISAALGMLFYGARGNTSVMMRHALGFHDSNLTNSDLRLAYQKLMETFSEEASTEYRLYVANAALIQEGHPFLTNYTSGLQSTFHALIKEVDFVTENLKVTREINEWARNKTHDQIPELLKEGELSSQTLLVLLNAVFFKGTWETEFNPADTFEGIFYNGGLTSQVAFAPMMHLKEELSYAESNDVKILELPYKGEHISMVILLPEAIDGLDQLEQDLSADTFRDMRKLTRKTKLYIAFPKFKLEFQKNLNSVLQTLGFDIFGERANFSGISETGPIRVTEVIHKAVVEVNEEGSHAAAITAIITGRSGIRRRDVQFIINHPFLFAIIDTRTDLILFQGRVNEF